VRQVYIEMESPHPVLHHVAHGFSLAPARHSDGLSIQVTGQGGSTGGASPSPSLPPRLRRQISGQRRRRVHAAPDPGAHYSGVCLALCQLGFAPCRGHGPIPAQGQGVGKRTRRSEIRSLWPRCVYTGQRSSSHVTRPQMAALQPVVLGLHVEKEMREFR